MPENDIKTTADIFQFLPTFSPLKRHHLSETTSSGKPGGGIEINQKGKWKFHFKR